MLMQLSKDQELMNEIMSILEAFYNFEVFQNHLCGVNTQILSLLVHNSETGPLLDFLGKLLAQKNPRTIDLLLAPHTMPRLAERLSEDPSFKAIMIVRMLLPSKELLKKVNYGFIESSLSHLSNDGIVGKISLEVVRAMA